MNATELTAIIQRGEDSAHQFKADELPVVDTSPTDIDRDYFDEFMQRAFGETLDEQSIDLAQLLANMNLLRDGALNLAALLLFGRRPHFRLPLCIIKAAAFPGTDIAVDRAGNQFTVLIARPAPATREQTT